MVASFFESRGMLILMESPIEGIFEDIILVDQNQTKVLVECKNTEVSPYSEDFLIPFGYQLYKYSKLPVNDRFRFVYFARRFSKVEVLKEIFLRYDWDKASILLEKSIHALKTKHRKEYDAAAKKLSSLPDDILKSFISRSEIYEADILTIAEKLSTNPRLAQNTIFRLLAPSKQIAESLKKINEVALFQERIVSNLYPVRSLPDIVSISKTKYRRARDLLDDIGQGVYPFILREDMILTFSDLEDINNGLIAAKSEYTVWKKPRHDVFNTSDKMRWLIHLLNESLYNHLKGLGMWKTKVSGRSIFYFPSINGREYRCLWNPGIKKIPRTITKLKKNFWKHQVISADFRIIGESFLMSLQPGYYFSEDGISRVKARLMTRLSSGAWARHGNIRLLYDNKFWMNLISNTKSVLEIETGSNPIQVDIQPESYDVNFGIADDYESHLVDPISRPFCRRFYQRPTRQSLLEEYDSVTEQYSLVGNNMEDDFDEWD